MKHSKAGAATVVCVHTSTDTNGFCAVLRILAMSAVGYPCKAPGLTCHIRKHTDVAPPRSKLKSNYPIGSIPSFFNSRFACSPVLLGRSSSRDGGRHISSCTPVFTSLPSPQLQPTYKALAENYTFVQGLIDLSRETSRGICAIG